MKYPNAIETTCTEKLVRRITENEKRARRAERKLLINLGLYAAVTSYSIYRAAKDLINN